MREFGSLGAAHFQDEIGIFVSSGRIGGDGGAGRFIFRIGDAGGAARIRLHGDGGAKVHKFLHRLRSGGHPRFGV